MANFTVSQTTNQNYLKAVSFQFRLEKAPKTTYNCQAGSLPGVSFDSIPVIAGGGRTLPLHVAATNPVYDDLELRFLVDENLENWREIYEWMISTQNAGDYLEGEQVADGPIEGLSDATLLVLSSAMNPIVQIQFYNLFPKALTGIDFDSTTLDLDAATASVTFAYQAYDLKTLP
jgi:hypothetical protein